MVIAVNNQPRISPVAIDICIVRVSTILSSPCMHAEWTKSAQTHVSEHKIIFLTFTKNDQMSIELCTNTVL